jgi:hypothetical protein
LCAFSALLKHRSQIEIANMSEKRTLSVSGTMRLHSQLFWDKSWLLILHEPKNASLQPHFPTFCTRAGTNFGMFCVLVVKARDLAAKDSSGKSGTSSVCL